MTLCLVSRLLVCSIALAFMTANASTLYVASQQEFDSALDSASMGDSIIWRSGTYTDIYMNISKDRLIISSERLGNTIFTSASRVQITANDITLCGFQFLAGDIGMDDVITIRGSFATITQINIRGYRCYKYLRVHESSQFADISYCNFENRLNLDDQNILSILVHESNPGYHKIRHCSFKNFDGIGRDMGIEPIRIGLSTQANRISRTLVEYCYFTRCDGDGEIISSKARQNVYRFNTFENNPVAELVLRHGSEAIVYGNFFLNGKGGVRVREGQNHYIYNNYFYQLDDRAIILQNEPSDPLDSIHIAFNTVLDCAEILLGGEGEDQPSHVTFSNNIFANRHDQLFKDPTGSETWASNIAFGNLGIASPVSGMTMIDPKLLEGAEGFFGLNEGSPAINAASPVLQILPSFEGIQDIDAIIAFDLMREQRPEGLEEKDIGALEFPHNNIIRPHATEENTGPSYSTSTVTNLQTNTLTVSDLISISPNPVGHAIQVSIYNGEKGDVRIDILDSEGRQVMQIMDERNYAGRTTVSKNISNLPAGIYTIRASSKERVSNSQRIQAIQFIKSN